MSESAAPPIPVPVPLPVPAPVAARTPVPAPVAVPVPAQGPPAGAALARRVTKLLLGCLLGYGALWACSVCGMLAATAWARGDASSGERTAAGIRHFLRVDPHLWRGSAPRAAGYRELAAQGIRTVVDLRAENLSPAERALPAAAGLRVVRLPVRDGQTPTGQQVDAFLRIVRSAAGPVYVHCGAGVGRTGSMAAAYLVRTGQAGTGQAALRTLAVGPPSIEQVYYVLNVSRGDTRQPPLAVRAVSRLLDAPRRIKASLP